MHSVPLGSSGSCGEHDDFTHNISNLFLSRANYKASALPVKVVEAKSALTLKFYAGNYPDEHDSHSPLKVEARFLSKFRISMEVINHPVNMRQHSGRLRGSQRGVKFIPNSAKVV